MEIVIKGILALFWLAVVPTAAGIPFAGKKHPSFSGFFLSGYLLLFSVMEILSLFMIYWKAPLHLLTAVYGCVGVGLAIFGLFYLKRNKDKLFAAAEKKERPSAYFWMAAAVILVQVAMCALLAHMDADDCFYVGTATTDVYTDTIFRVNPYRGSDYFAIPKRYILSPFPAFLAVISQLSAGLHPAIMAHVVFPVIFLPMAYMVQILLAQKWFPESRKARDIYLLLAACLCSFSGYSVYNAGNFQMVRIWQGKAVLAAILIPLLIWSCISLLLEKESEGSWHLLVWANISCCLVSSMGIILAPLLTGCFLLLSLVLRRDWRRVAKGILCCLPSIVFGVIYILIG